MGRSGCLLALACAIALSCQSEPRSVAPDPAYISEIERWRAEREAKLKKPDGWLSLVGLHWLEEGESRFGSGADNELVLPPPAPESLGVFKRSGDEVLVEARPGAGLRSSGEAVERLELAPDTTGEPTILEYETLSFYVIKRGSRVGVRVKSSTNELLRTFAGMESYPIDPEWRLDAHFDAFEEPSTVLVPNVIGEPLEETVPGAIVFSVEGREYRLEPTGDPEKSLFLVFGDETNGQGTYGGGRFLYTEPPGPDGAVVVDFNKAYNPPCVFTPYATCPLPTAENKLALRIEAGEKTFAGGH